MKMRLSLFSVAVCFLLGLPQLPAQMPAKRVLLEKVTSAGCPGCPNGDLILQDMIAADSSLIVVAMHRNDYWHPDSMHSSDGDAIISEYLWAHPTVMVDRIKWPDFAHVCLLSSMWQPKVDLRQAEPIRATVGGSTVYDPQTRSLSVTVNAIAAASLNNDYRLNAYLVESPVSDTGIGYNQLNGNNTSPGHPLFGLGDPIPNYAHHWVLRDMLGGHHGEPGSFPTTSQAGTSGTHTFNTILDPRWNADNMYVVVLIQKHNADPQAREILNAQVVEFNASVLASTHPDLESVYLNAYPQPATASVRINLPRDGRWDLSLHDLQGRAIWQAALNGASQEIARGPWPAGIYLLRATNSAGQSHSIKVQFD